MEPRVWRMQLKWEDVEPVFTHVDMYDLKLGLEDPVALLAKLAEGSGAVAKRLLVAQVYSL